MLLEADNPKSNAASFYYTHLQKNTEFHLSHQGMFHTAINTPPPVLRF
jgi:hypothetical protein